MQCEPVIIRIRFHGIIMCDEAGIYVMAETNLESHGTHGRSLVRLNRHVNVPGSIPQWREAVVDRART